MGGEVATLARNAGGSVFVTTSRRTGTDAAGALLAALGNVTVHSYQWSAVHSEEENPYLGYLALADILVVSGESASMLAEASATGKPVFIYPLAKRGKDVHSIKFLLGQRVSQWIMRRAFARPVNRRGWERPQAGLELLCARLAARGWVRPHGDITKLHEALIERGSARYFDGALPDAAPEPLNEAARVAERVRSLFGVEADRS
jgi:mitochondrial fission protein ELM1